MRSAKLNSELGLQSLEKREFSRAKRLLQSSQSNGLSEDPAVRLAISKCFLGLGEFDDASREAQKVISAGAGAASIDAYLVRAEALQATG